ncbi:hypothetical protein PYCC9005_000566 [Savitreella phatthalungensis]
MGKERPVSELADGLSRLHLRRTINGRLPGLEKTSIGSSGSSSEHRRRSGTTTGTGYRISSADTQIFKRQGLLESILDADGDVLQVDTNYPTLLLISDLILGYAQQSSAQKPSGAMTRLASLVRQCGIPSDMQYTYLQHFAFVTGRMLFSDADLKHTSDRLSGTTFQPAVVQEAVIRNVLRLCLRHTCLYMAIVAVAGLHCVRSGAFVHNHDAEDARQRMVSKLYRVRQRAESLLLHRERESNEGAAIDSAAGVSTLQEAREAYALTSSCMLLFDALTGSIDAWRARLPSTRMWLRELGPASVLGRQLFAMLILHERIAMLVAEDDAEISILASMRRKSLDSLDELMSQPANEHAIPAKGSHDSDTPDRVGFLHAELLRILKLIDNISDTDDEDRIAEIWSSLDRWKENFPLSLQLHACHGEVHDASCFYPGLTCPGGIRSITLHVRYCETMIRLLLLPQSNHFQRSKIHEQVVTACKLIGSMIGPSTSQHGLGTRAGTKSDQHAAELAFFVTDNTCVAAAVMTISPALHLCARHVFSTSARRWALSMLRYLSDVSGNLLVDRMADALERRFERAETLATDPDAHATMSASQARIPAAWATDSDEGVQNVYATDSRFSGAVDISMAE